MLMQKSPSLDLSHEKEVNVIHNLLKKAHYAFFTWKYLHDEDYYPTYEKNPFFWIATFNSLQDEWLMALARVYEKSSHTDSGKVISAFGLVKKQKDSSRAGKARALLKEHEELIKNIYILRSNRLAHLNYEHIMNGTKLTEKYPIEYDKVERLLAISDDLLTNLHPEEGQGYLLYILKDDAKHSVMNLMEKLA
jgi:hypothetical protein